MKKLVIIPTYNEKENIRNIINAVFALEQDLHVLIVDDSSPDGTAQIVEEMRKEFPTHLHLLIRKVKDGLGKAYIAGFKWALEYGYEYIFEMDTSRLFNSAAKLTRSVTDSGGVIRFVPGVTLSDSTVYYWRLTTGPVTPVSRWLGSSYYGI